MSLLPDFDRAILEDRPPSIGPNLFDVGARAVTQLDEARQVFNDAAEGARQAPTALEEQLAYIPDTCERTSRTVPI